MALRFTCGRLCLIVQLLISLYLLYHLIQSHYHDPQQVTKSNKITSTQIPQKPTKADIRIELRSEDDSPGFDYFYHNISRHQVNHFAEGLQLYIHTAFRDTFQGKNVIHVLGIAKRALATGGMSCRWEIDSEDIILAQHVTARRYLLDRHWYRSLYYACEFLCDMPVGEMPDVITLVSSNSRFKLDLRIEESVAHHPPYTLGVCVPPLRSTYGTSRLVEWIELQRMVGIDNFLLYTEDLYGADRYVIEYYQRYGLVTLVSFPFIVSVMKEINPRSVKVIDALKQQLHLVALQDCLLRFKGSFQLLQVVTLDQVILPTEVGMNLPEILIDLVKERDNITGLSFLTSWHFGDVESTESQLQDGYMINHRKATYPTTVLTNSSSSPLPLSSVALTKNTNTLTFRGPKSHLHGRMKNLDVTSWENHAYSHYFTSNCPDKLQAEVCSGLGNQTRLDPVIMAQAVVLWQRVRDILDFLQV